jgi:hypothetical protein
VADIWQSLRPDCSRPVAFGVAVAGACLLWPIFTGLAKPYWSIVETFWDWARMDFWGFQFAVLVLMVVCPAIQIVTVLFATIRLMFASGIPRWLVLVWALDVPVFVAVVVGALFLHIASGGGRIAH